MCFVVDSPLGGWPIRSAINPPARCQMLCSNEEKAGMKRLAFTVLWSTILFVATSSAATSPIRVLLLDGQSGGPYHNWQLTTPVLKKELEDTGRFQVTVATSPQSGRRLQQFQA